MTANWCEKPEKLLISVMYFCFRTVTSLWELAWGCQGRHSLSPPGFFPRVVSKACEQQVCESSATRTSRSTMTFRCTWHISRIPQSWSELIHPRTVPFAPARRIEIITGVITSCVCSWRRRNWSYRRTFASVSQHGNPVKLSLKQLDQLWVASSFWCNNNINWGKNNIRRGKLRFCRYSTDERNRWH